MPILLSKRLLILSLSSLLLAGCGSDNDNNRVDDSDPPPAGEEPAFTLQLLHFADVDGSGGADDVEIFSALVTGFRDERPDTTLLLSSGDNLIPGPEFFAANDDSMTETLGEPGNGRANIAWLNAMGVQASVVGNHDLDTGTGDFADLLSADGDWPGASFPYLSANIDFSADSATAPLEVPVGNAPEPSSLTASVVIDVAGEPIGVVGASVPTLPSITSTGGLVLSPADFDSAEAADLDALAAEIQPAVDALVDEGINKIILLAHMQQLAVERALAERLEDVDVIVAGGSNSLLADANDRLREGDTAADTYPLSFTSPTDEPVLVVNVDGDFTYLGRLVLGFDEAGVIVTDSLDSEVNGAWATDELPEGFEPLAEVEAITSALEDVLIAKDGNVLGFTEVYLDGRRSQVRTEETNLGNLTADANLWLARQQDNSVQVSLKNGGGIRDDIGQALQPPGSTDPSEIEFLPPAENPLVGKPEGGISQLDLETSLRFNNSLVMLTLTPAELADVMEHAFAASGEGAQPGQFPQIGGMRVEFDASQPARASGDTNQKPMTTNRLRELEILDEQGNTVADLVTQGVVDETQDPVRVVTLGFLASDCVTDDAASCGDGYPFKDLDNPNRQAVTADPGLSDFSEAGGEQDALAEFLRAQFPDADTAFDQAETSVEQDERIVNVSASN